MCSPLIHVHVLLSNQSNLRVNLLVKALRFQVGYAPYRWEDIKGLAVGLESLHLAGKPGAAILPLAPVEGAHTNGITRSNEVPRRLVQKHAGKDAVQRVPQLVRVPQFLYSSTLDRVLILSIILMPAFPLSMHRNIAIVGMLESKS